MEVRKNCFEAWKYFYFKLENYSATNTCWQHDCKTEHSWSCKKMGTKKEPCYQVKYLKHVFFFPLIFKSVTSSNSNKQMTARNTLKPASCLHWAHHIWCLGLLTVTLIFFIWFWSKATGEDFKVTSIIWISFYLKEEIREEMVIHSPSNEKKIIT